MCGWCLCIFVPSYHCHHPHRPAGCCWTVRGQKRWDPGSSTESSGNHLSSVCHILQDRQKQRYMLHTQGNTGLYWSPLACQSRGCRPRWTLPSAAHTSSRRHLLRRGCGVWVWVCVCQCVIRREFINECVCVTRGGGYQFQSVTHRWQSYPSLSSIPPPQGAFSTSSLSFSLCKYLQMHPLSSPLIANYIHVVRLQQSRLHTVGFCMLLVIPVTCVRTNLTHFYLNNLSMKKNYIYVPINWQTCVFVFVCTLSLTHTNIKNVSGLLSCTFGIYSVCDSQSNSLFAE